MSMKEFFNKPGVGISILAVVVLLGAIISGNEFAGLAGTMLFCTGFLCEHISISKENKK